MMSLYFIAIIPPDEICEEITTIKRDFAKRFNSRHALKVIPHITLKAPFQFPAEQDDLLLQWFEKLPVTTKPFIQELQNFGCFNNKRSPVIFIEPLMNESLLLLQENIIDDLRINFPFIATDRELNFKPHMTVAYRDLLPHQFHKAWHEYKDKKYERTFEVNSFHLLQHNNRKWNSLSLKSLSKGKEKFQ